ncbi:MAG: hypothetical protein ACK55I_20670, partial [bacterium]
MKGQDAFNADCFREASLFCGPGPGVFADFNEFDPNGSNSIRFVAIRSGCSCFDAYGARTCGWIRGERHSRSQEAIHG